MIEGADASLGAPSDAPSGSPDFGSPVADTVYRLLEPAISTLGVELIDVEWTGGTLRLSIDAPDAEGGVTTQQLADVNRLVSPLLDQHDPVPGRYLLEVSSPGVERPLRRPDHFRRAVGEQVIVKLQPGADPRRIRGELTAADDATVTITAVEVDGIDLAEVETHQVSHDEIAKARTHFDWGPTPKKGGKAKSGNQKSGDRKSGNQKSGNQKSGNQKSGGATPKKPKSKAKSKKSQSKSTTAAGPSNTSKRETS